MYWTSGIVVFVIVWWLVFFMMLPVGVKIPDQPGEGHATSAPEKPMLLKKALITTAIAAVLTAAAFLVIQSEYLSFRG
ncbi:MAG: DUF1467 family protein [Alphaproteobacteria bacterium]|nr:DUF1467 family protein [Alphaproteobacteria bacterium]MBU0798382.1 DUF1467 family protein [Alphaproteobacteria bacterium]MBU0887803.1 DUF1467 family protein [Alphaproteobacteria bacterium]MBU1814974.1 DUF1467 family protein [Alphaproteobacteria bacterium]MBU2089779.1 DUF1467 family protein [Alphaproteobacteria bacterium]